MFELFACLNICDYCMCCLHGYMCHVVPTFSGGHEENSMFGIMSAVLIYSKPFKSPFFNNLNFLIWLEASGPTE